MMNGAAMAVYRAPGERDERPDIEQLHRGPRDACPACGAANIWNCNSCKRHGPIAFVELPGRCGKNEQTDLWCGEKRERIERVSGPLFCASGRRVRVGPWWWPRRCKLVGEHLHQRCTICRATWICAPVTV